MSMKQFNAKQAERWLQRLKSQNLQSYKDVTKFLRKYERTDDEYDCYLKISHTLLSHTELTKEINLFLEQGNRFIVTRPEDQKLRDFMGYVKNNRPEIFNRIISMIQQLSKSKGEGNQEVSKLIMPKLKEIVAGDPQLEKLTDESLGMSDQELIKRKNLDHLKINRIFTQIPDQHKDNQPSDSAAPKEKKSIATEPKIVVTAAQDKKEKQLKASVLGGFTNVAEERIAIKQLQKSIDHRLYRDILKVIKVYTLNLITKKEAFDILAGACLQEIHLQNLKDILEAREVERRKHSFFKPLGDINFSSYERASPSYVTLPFFYPVKCSGKTPAIRAVTNDKWISVPYGSEQNENFSVRNKNTNEINLLKAEDERYQFDLYMKKLVRTKDLLDKYLQGATNDSQNFEGIRILNKALELGIIQILYKNCRQEQKEQLQNYLQKYPVDTCRLFREKLMTEIMELRSIREIHAIKSWSQTANKNFYKALDLKGFEFKKNEKEKMRNGYLMTELNERNKIVANGGETKSNTLNFQEKKEFFGILNSFECSSRTQKCSSRVLPPFKAYDLKDSTKRNFYPIFILSFEDELLCQKLYSLLIFYIEAASITETQKYKCKLFLEQYLVGYLGWKAPIRKNLTQYFNEDLLIQKIAGNSVQFECDQCLIAEAEPTLLRRSLQNDAKKGDPKKPMGVLHDNDSKYSYLPKRGDENSVLYCSQHVYCLTRYLYAIYQRFIKMRQVAESQEKLKLFELLFISSVKVKEGIKFQQNLSTLFGNHAYLFGTIYKLFDSLIKSIVQSSICMLTSNSFKFAQQQPCEDLYFVLVNRFCLTNSLTNSKLIRLTFNKTDKVLYVNALDSYYKADETAKDMIRRRSEISKLVEMDTVEFYETTTKRVRRSQDYYQTNGQEYVFGSSSIKMTNHGSHEDVLLMKRVKENVDKVYTRQIKRIHQFFGYTN